MACIGFSYTFSPPVFPSLQWSLSKFNFFVLTCSVDIKTSKLYCWTCHLPTVISEYSASTEIIVIVRICLFKVAPNKCYVLTVVVVFAFTSSPLKLTKCNIKQWLNSILLSSLLKGWSLVLNYKCPKRCYGFICDFLEFLLVKSSKMFTAQRIHEKIHCQFCFLYIFLRACADTRVILSLCAVIKL